MSGPPRPVLRARAPGWLEDPEPGPLRRAALAPLLPAAGLYAAGAWIARHARGRRLRPPARLPCRVVSVGSLVVGGAGKTPAAAWLAARLHERGHVVAIASRGYGRRSRAPVTIVSDGRFVRAAGGEAGDEPLLLCAHAPGVPVLVGRDRARVGQRACALFGCDVLVLDDGFQHHRLARDAELLCFDGAGLASGWPLPRGPLRESLCEARRADAVLVVDGPLPERDAERLERHAGAVPWFAARRLPVWVRPLAGGPKRAPASLAGLRVGLLAGLARPDALRRTVESLGAVVVASRIFRDHHRYRERDLRSLPARPATWITSEKDAVKIRPSWCAGIDLRVLGIELAVEDDAGLVDHLERRLVGAHRAAPGPAPVDQRAALR